MVSRKTLPVWIGIILLSGMFLMGQDAWVPPSGCPELPTGMGTSQRPFMAALVDCDDPSLDVGGSISFLTSTIAAVDLSYPGHLFDAIHVTYSTSCEDGMLSASLPDDACFEIGTRTPGVVARGCVTSAHLNLYEGDWPGHVGAFEGTATYYACFFNEGEEEPISCPHECPEENPAEIIGGSFLYD